MPARSRPLPPPLPPPNVELPPPRRNRAGPWLSLIAHLILVLTVVELTRESNFWNAGTEAAAPRDAKGGGGGGARVHLMQLPATPPPPPAVVPRVTPPVQVPTRIPPPTEQPAPTPPVDTLPRTAAPADTSGSGGGSGGGAGGGAGQSVGPGSGTSGTGGTGNGDSTRTGARPPEPRQLILPPFDYPRTMRGQSIDVNFFVLADGRVDHVVFVPEIPDRAYAKKLEDAMRAYRFRPARSSEGQAVPGVAVVRVSF